jgi:hypothetical protein
MSQLFMQGSSDWSVLHAENIQLKKKCATVSKPEAFPCLRQSITIHHHLLIFNFQRQKITTTATTIIHGGRLDSTP